MPTTDPMICDFCSRRDPRWLYPCRTFGAPGLSFARGESRGAWAACDGCSELIERADRKALLARAFDAIATKHPQLRRPGLDARARRNITDLHTLFAAFRDGPRRAL